MSLWHVQKIGASPWLALIHDLSKFRPSEWIPYAYTFYAADGSKQYHETVDFARAWNKHQKRNKHHWEHWIHIGAGDDSPTLAWPMSRRYVLEMVADWMGAGRAITGRWEVSEWYDKNKGEMIMYPEARKLVENILQNVGQASPAR